MSLNKDDLTLLVSPFDEKTLGVKVQSTSRDKTKAMLVCYLQHTDVAARLDSVDPSWGCEISDEKLSTFTNSLGKVETICTTRTRITVKGVTREGVGEGQDPKSAASDSMKRAAMLFGVGRYLYDSETVWVPYNEASDKFKQWTYAEYKAALRPGQAPVPTGSAAPAGTVSVIKPNVAAQPGAPLSSMNRAQLGKAINDLAAEIGLKAQDEADWIMDLYKKPLNQLTQIEMINFHGVLEGEKAHKQERFL